MENRLIVISLGFEVWLFKHKTPPTESRTASSSHPSPQRFTAQENAVIEEIMAVIFQHGLNADHAKTLLARTIQLLEWGKQATHETPQANA